MPPVRRLTAILAADVVEFHRRIDADLGSTLRALEAIRRDLLDPTIAAHNGRVLRKSDDLLVVEFGNVVEALTCATHLQRTIAEYNRNLPAENRIEFRIGIHQGDVVIQDGHLFGDGVNTAVGLEGLAQPGGICLSARAKEDAEGKLAVQFEDMGEQRFKNRSRPIHTYQIPPGGASSAGISEKPTRRLVAILAADVAGYSRLMGADEEGTHEQLKAHLRELVKRKIAEHRGRMVKNTGDGFLADFPSVVDAVRCAVEVQQGMVERNEATPPEKRIEFRIGINLGDVIAEADDIYGDGVNIAARLEALAEPGGICVSRVVRDQIRDRLDYTFEDLGEQSVKNIARPVRVYAWRLQGEAGLPATSVPIAVSTRRRSIHPIGAAVAAMIVIAVVTWWFWPLTRSPSTTPVAAAATTTVGQPLAAPRLSIVVLPFANLSNDPDQQYFIDGITEDLTTDLSHIPDMVVIAGSTAFAFKNKPIDAKQIGRELGVRYMLEGSVQRSKNQIRVNAQLIDAATSAHLWAERFDRDVGDLFALQNEITMQIARALGVELINREAARTTERPDAFDYILQGRAVLWKPPSRDNFAQAIGLFEHALALDPQSVEAKSWLAFVLAERVLNGMSGSKVIDLERADGLVVQALSASPHKALIHVVKGTVLRAQNGWEKAIPEYETALASDPNLVTALHGLALCKLFTGAVEQVIPLEERSIRLSPRDPAIGWWYSLIGTVHLLQSHADEAIVWLTRGNSALPGVAGIHSRLAAAYALRDETERAAAELAEARRLNGHAYTTLAHLKAGGSWGVPKVRALFEATYFAGLRKAGMPEE